MYIRPISLWIRRVWAVIASTNLAGSVAVVRVMFALDVVEVLSILIKPLQCLLHGLHQVDGQLFAQVALNDDTEHGLVSCSIMEQFALFLRQRMVEVHAVATHIPARMSVCV